jgi:hypothetical protein
LNRTTFRGNVAGIRDGLQYQLVSSTLHHLLVLELGENAMRWFVNAMLAGLATTTLLTSPVSASMIYAGPSPAMATDQSLSLNFSYGSGTAALSFIIDGYKSLDGKNAYEDDFSLKLNNQQVFLGTFNLEAAATAAASQCLFESVWSFVFQPDK